MLYTYLCGGIKGLTDAEAMEWREYATARLQTGILDPMVRDYRGRDNAALEENLIPRDLADIRKSDFLLVNASRPSWGTAMELVYASQWHIPAIAFVNGPPEEASPWLRYHLSACYATIDEAIMEINKRVDLAVGLE